MGLTCSGNCDDSTLTTLKCAGTTCALTTDENTCCQQSCSSYPGGCPAGSSTITAMCAGPCTTDDLQTCCAPGAITWSTCGDFDCATACSLPNNQACRAVVDPSTPGNTCAECCIPPSHTVKLSGAKGVALSVIVVIMTMALALVL